MHRKRLQEYLQKVVSSRKPGLWQGEECDQQEKEGIVAVAATDALGNFYFIVEAFELAGADRMESMNNQARKARFLGNRKANKGASGATTSSTRFRT